jgi:starch synthase
VPDVVHCHDWQAGLTPAYLAFEGGRVATVQTIHNLAYQGNFPADLLSPLRLPANAFGMDGVEFYGKIGFLKAGLQFADRITTVSPTYAAEIRTPEYGAGLDGLLRARSGVLSGITNGIDTEVWNPEHDKHIPTQFGRTTLHRRAENTAHLRRRFGLNENPDRLLIGVVSRFVWQKGLDILADAAPAFIAAGAQLAMLGTGEPELEQRFSSLADAHPGQAGCIVAYDEDLAHLMQAGADVLLVPSRFEPCGVTQLCAMRYGAVPIVSKVGGLGDTVTDVAQAGANGATGFHISPVARQSIEAALHRALTYWADKKQWRQLQINGMGTDVCWEKPAQQYARLYADLLVAKDKPNGSVH